MKLFQTKLIASLLLISAVFLLPTFASAALYAPGATLDPACAPADVSCGVTPPVGAGTQGQVPYYAAAGSGVVATSSITILQNGSVSIIGTTTVATLISQIQNGCYNTDQYSSVQAAITAAGTSGCITITPLTTDTGWWTNTNGLTIIDQRQTARVGQFLGGASVIPKLANFASGTTANKKIVYFGNSTVWSAYNWYDTFARQSQSGGLMAGMNVHTDLVSLAADSSGNATVVLSSPSGFTVGQFVSVEPTGVGTNVCVGSGTVTAVSGNQFTYKTTGTAANLCANITTTSTGGIASQQLLNFGGNGATLSSMLADTSATSTGIGGICAVKPDLLIIRGPLINDVRTGGTNLAQATARIKQMLDMVRSCTPNTDILLKTENSLLTTDVSSNGFVSPNSSAQAYSTILEQAVIAFTNVYPNVVVLDTQKSLFGTTSPATSPYMGDQLHPNSNGQTAEAQQDIQVITQYLNNGFATVGTVDPNSTAVVPFSPYLAQLARASSYTQPWQFYSRACADPNYYTLVASGGSNVSNPAGQTYLRFSFNSGAAAVIQSFDVVEQQGSGCWQLANGTSASNSSGNTQVNLGGGSLTPYPTYINEQINIWRPKYIAQAAEPYIKNTTTYTYHRRVNIQTAGTNFFRIYFLPSEGINPALSNIQTSDVLVLNATTTLPLSSCSFTPSVAGSFLQCNITGDESALQGQYGWVFGAHPMEGQSNSANQTIFGGSQKPAYSTLTVWGPDALAATSLFALVNSASTTLLQVNDAGYVGIGTTSPVANLSVQKNYGSASTSLFTIASSTSANGTTANTLFNISSAGNVTVNGSSGSTCTIGDGVGGTSCTSDQRLKTNITPIANALEGIEQLNGVTFNWLDTSKNQQQFIGVIAQDVQKVFPQAVSTTESGFLSVDYGALVAPLIEAVKELANKVAALKDFITARFPRSDTLCLDDVCINKTQLQRIIDQQGGQQTVSPSPTDEPVVDISAPTPPVIDEGTDDSASSTEPTDTQTDNLDEASSTPQNSGTL